MLYLRTLYILWLRQLKRYFRSKPRILGSLGQPLLFLIALGFGLGPVFQDSGRGDYIQFLVPGIVAMSILFMAMFSGIELIWDRRFGFLKRTLVAPVPRWAIMLGKALGGATVATVQGIVVLVISFLFGFELIAGIWQVVMGIAFMFLLALLFTLLGIAIASHLEDTQSFPLIINFVIFPIFFLSGALFPLQGLSGGLAIVTKLNPLTFGVDALRYSFISSQHFSLGFDLSVLIGVTLLVWAIGTYLFVKIRI